MSLDHHDAAAVDRFTEDVDRALETGCSGPQGWTVRLIALWLVAGALFSAALRSHDALATVLYVVGLGVVAVWVGGFYLARGERERWFGGR
jgi:hypothetical protein